MAQEIAVKLNFDSGQSVKEIEKLDNVLKDIKKNTDVSNVNEQFQKLNATIDKGGNSAEDLQRAVKSYQTIALTAGRTSPIGQEALKRSAALKDQLTDLDNEVKRLANDHKNLQGAMQIGSSVLGGYSALQGVTALVGEENEALMQTMVKLQAVQSSMNGLMEIRTALEKESNAMLLIQSARQKVVNGLTIAYNAIIKGTNTALGFFKKALIATGLGAIVVLIGTLVNKWDEWKDGIISFIETALEPLLAPLRALGIIEDENAKARRLAMEEQKKQALERLEMLETEKEALEIRYAREIELAKATGENTSELERESLVEFLNIQKEKLKSLQQLFAVRSQLSFDEKKKLLEDSQEVLKSVDELNHKIKVFDAKQEKERNDRVKKASENRTKIRQKEADEALKIEQKRQDKLEELRKSFEDLAVANIEDEAQRELTALRLKHQREREALKEEYGKDTELLKTLERAQETERLAVIEEIRKAQEEKDKEEELARQEKERADKEAKLQAELQFNANLAEVIRSSSQAEEERTRAVIQARENLLNATSKVVTDLGSLLGENEKAQRAFAVAQASIDTAKAISSLVAMSQANPANALTGGVAGALQYATGVIRIITSMKKVYRLLKAGSPVAPPSVSTSGSSSSSTSQNEDNNGIVNVGRTEFVNNQQPQKAIVVESEVNAVREKANNLNRIAVI